MASPRTSRPEWLAAIRSAIQPVGDCMEWQGAMRGTVPVVHCPRDYLWPDSARAKQSVRSVLYLLATGERVPSGSIIRMRCWNEACVHEDHFQLITRTEQAAEQSRRGELQTGRMRAARMRVQRARAKLDQAKVDLIRSGEASDKELAARFGVSRQAITSARIGKTWATLLPGASVFSFGGGR